MEGSLPPPSVATKAATHSWIKQIEIVVIVSHTHTWCSLGGLPSRLRARHPPASRESPHSSLASLAAAASQWRVRLPDYLGNPEQKNLSQKKYSRDFKPVNNTESLSQDEDGAARRPARAGPARSAQLGVARRSPLHSTSELQITWHYRAM